MFTSMPLPRKPLGLLPRILSTSTALAIGFGLFLWCEALSQASGPADDGPVVLELFTSEGCSSCPPADALLSELGFTTKGVIPLAYHVDYWNHLGWSDPFSSRQFSERQSDYAHAMDLSREYTPQMVIAGGSQCVGSDGRSIERAIEAARSAPAPDHLDLDTELSSPRILRVRLNARVRESESTSSIAMVAVYENGLVSKIGGGENGGREITYDYTVRKLVPVLKLDRPSGTSAEKVLSIALDPSWSLKHLGVAAFIQNTSSLRITGATSRYPIEKD
jgi:hypothetical protein